MFIQKTYLKFTGSHIERTFTDLIIVHHTATTTDYTVSDIHSMHISNGWSGIGYHFYIRKDGSVFEGRPLKMVGAHAEGYNYRSISVCLSGNFEIESPTPAQLDSLSQTLAYLKGLYPNAKIIGHREVNSTACPGTKLFAVLPEILNGESKKSASVSGKLFAHDGKICAAIGTKEYNINSGEFNFKLRQKHSDKALLSGKAYAENGFLTVLIGDDAYVLESDTLRFKLNPKS